MSDSRKYLNPRVLNKVARLDLKARFVVEGFIAGLHRSPYRGVSVDFADYREYVPGDDIRFIDWKAYGKTNRLYIKEFEEETNLTCHLFLDVSESMEYGSLNSDGERIRKFDYATWVAAALAHLLLRQRDAVSLTLFQEQSVSVLPPSNGRIQLLNIIRTLDQAKPGQKTSVATSLHEMAERVQRRGIVVILSDFFDDVPSILGAIKHLRHRGHEVILFHILDAQEVEFPFDRITMFEGLEELPKLLVDPKALREAYLGEFSQFLEALKTGCTSQLVDYVEARTDASLEKLLVSYLGKRESRLRRRR